MPQRRGVVPVVRLLLAGLPAGAAAAPATKRCPDDPAARCGSVLVPLYRGAPDGGGRRLARALPGLPTH